MSEARINEKILEYIRDNSKEMENIQNFLIDIIFLEAKRTGNWRWKETYKEMIEKNISREK